MLRLSYPITDMNRPQWFQEVEDSSISKQSAHKCGKVVSPEHRPPLPPEDTLYVNREALNVSEYV
jgi:hypothetical protein